MPDMPDLLHTPLPDRAHEALRVAVVGAVDHLTEQVERIDDAYALLLAAVGGMQGSLNVSQSATGVLAQVQAQLAALKQQAGAQKIRDDADQIRDGTSQDCIDVLQEQVAALTKRVDALEAYDVTPQQS